jgi:hypothetical protein
VQSPTIDWKKIGVIHYVEGLMKIYTFYTDSHSGLFRDYFLPSVPEGMEVIVVRVDRRGD